MTIQQLLKGREGILQPSLQEAKKGMGPRAVTIIDVFGTSQGLALMVKDPLANHTFTVMSYRVDIREEHQQ